MKFDKKALTLYAVTDRAWLNGRDFYAVIEEALKGGATFLQLREKDISDEEFLSIALKIKPIAEKYKVPFVINDNISVAIKCGADGVHVGQSDIMGKDIRAMIGDDMILGISANTVEAAKNAERAGADYIGVGAVFSTATKKNAQNITVEKLREICSSVSIPAVAIGGITEQNILSLSGSGTAGAAVVSALFRQEDIFSAAKRLKPLCEHIAKG